MCRANEIYKQIQFLCTTGAKNSNFWAELDLNQRRYKPTNLQYVPFNHSGIDPLKNNKKLFNVIGVYLAQCFAPALHLRCTV